MIGNRGIRVLLCAGVAAAMVGGGLPGGAVVDVHAATSRSAGVKAVRATKITKASQTKSKRYTAAVGSKVKLKYRLSPSKLPASARKVVWKSNNKKIVSISKVKSGSAVVTFKGTGKAQVTVKSRLNSRAKVTWKFNVLSQETQQLTGVTVTNDDSALDVKNSVQVGDTLHAAITPADATATYQWYLDGAAIEGATAADYNAAQEDVGKALSVKVTGTGAFEGTVSFGPTAAVTDPYAGAGTTTVTTVEKGGKQLPPLFIKNETLIKDYQDSGNYPSYAEASDRASLFPVYRVGDKLTVTTSLSAEDCDITWVLVRATVNNNVAASNFEVVETLGKGGTFTIPDNDENLVNLSFGLGNYSYYVQAVATGKGDYQGSRSESVELTYYADNDLPGTEHLA